MASQVLASPAPGPAAAAAIPAVVVMDDDSACLQACGSLLDDLGFPNHCVTNARDALERVTDDPAVQILFPNMHMGACDGFTFIEEARARVGAERALVAVLMAEQPCADLAIRGMHVGAVDLLCKPLERDTCSTALRRAMRFVEARRGSADVLTLSECSERLTRLIATLERKHLDCPPEDNPSDKDMIATLRTIIASRGLRSRFFPSEMFADPAWDILLDLTRARLENQQVSVSSVCIAASVPMSTALRWVRQMTEAGLLRRWTDPNDRRRDLIALTEPTAAHMRDYLSSVRTLMKKV